MISFIQLKLERVDSPQRVKECQLNTHYCHQYFRFSNFYALLFLSLNEEGGGAHEHIHNFRKWEKIIPSKATNTN